MASKPPEKGYESLLPSNWDLEDEGTGATREVETDELFAQAGFLEEMPPPPPLPVLPPPPPPPSLPRPRPSRPFVPPMPPGRSPAVRVPPPSFEETQPMSRPPATMRPSMPQDEYVEHMMRQAPPSDAGLMSLTSLPSLLPPEPEDSFGKLTPWPASVPPDNDPASISNLFEVHPGVLGPAPLPADFHEDMGRTGSGFGEVDLDELVPEILGSVGGTRAASPPPPQVEMDELDEMLIDEVMRTVRDETDNRPSLSALEDLDSMGLDLSFDEPAFMPASEPVGSVVPSTIEHPGDIATGDDEPDYADRSDADTGDAEMGDYETVDLEQLETTTYLPRVVPVAPPPVEEPPPDSYGPPTSELAPDTVQDFVFAVAAVGELPALRLDSSLRGRLERVRARFEVGDFSGALVIAEGMLEEDARHLAAKCYADACRAMLRQMYMSKMGEKSGVLRLVVEPDQLKGLMLDHRAGFLISCIDGVSTIDEILDVSGMPPLDALRILYELIQEGVVEAESPPSRRR